MSKVQKTPSWLDKQQKTVEDRRQKTMKEKGIAEFYTLEEGETKVYFDLEKEPREQNGDFGLRTIFRVTIDAKQWDLSTSDALARRVLNAIKAGINPMTIIRIGENKETRFSIKELKKSKNKQ